MEGLVNLNFKSKSGGTIANYGYQIDAREEPAHDLKKIQFWINIAVVIMCVVFILVMILYYRIKNME